MVLPTGRAKSWLGSDGGGFDKDFKLKAQRGGGGKKGETEGELRRRRSSSLQKNLS